MLMVVPKLDMEKALASIAREGWLPMAAAMLGTVDKPPMWANVWDFVQWLALQLT